MCMPTMLLVHMPGPTRGCQALVALWGLPRQQPPIPVKFEIFIATLLSSIGSPPLWSLQFPNTIPHCPRPHWDFPEWACGQKVAGCHPALCLSSVGNSPFTRAMFSPRPTLSLTLLMSLVGGQSFPMAHQQHTAPASLPTPPPPRPKRLTSCLPGRSWVQ